MYSEIYLVDDVEMVNLRHQVMLRQLGMEDKVKSFTNPEDALDDLRFKARENKPILVLLDIYMPEMSGFEFLEFMALEDFPLNIKVIIVTSSVTDEDKILAEQFPQYVCDFVAKPIELENLRESTTAKLHCV